MEDSYFEVLGLHALLVQLGCLLLDGRIDVPVRTLGDVGVVTEELVAGIFHRWRVDEIGFTLDVLGYLIEFLQGRVFAQDARATGLHEHEESW